MKKTSPNFVKLINILNDGLYHDGTTLGDKLNMTRSAVWKAIKKLQEYGICVDSVKGKGYALLEPLILLDKNKIKRSLGQVQVDVQCFESIDSTNNYLKNVPHAQQIKICLAEQQTMGKGRLNRAWHSPFGQNIYFSCLYPFQKDVSELAGLSLVVSLAVVKTLEVYRVPDRLLVKWPNDVLYQQKKISGNLIEIQAESHGVSQAIIGIGINVNMMQDDEQAITQAWTSLRQMTSTYIDRNQFCARLINELITYLKQFEQQGLASFLVEWKQVDYLYNKDIAFKNGDKKIYGKAEGIDAQGRLMMKLRDGSLGHFSSGDTTIFK